MQDRIMVFIPAYNCAKQVVRVLEQFDSDVIKYIKEIVVVNNLSTDDTESVAVEYGKIHSMFPLTVMRNLNNYNLGGSHKVAFNYAIAHDYDYVIVLHGDDQGDIHDLLPLLKSGEYQKYDSLLGARFLKDSMLVNYSAFRIFGNHIFNMFISLCVGQKISDLGSGLNMYKVSYLKSRFYMPFKNTLTFNVYMLLYGIFAKSNFRFFPLSWRESDQVSNAKFFKQSCEILSLVMRYVCSAQKLFGEQQNHWSEMNYSSVEVYRHGKQQY